LRASNPRHADHMALLFTGTLSAILGPVTSFMIRTLL
jgi:hypothetical protein